MSRKHPVYQAVVWLLALSPCVLMAWAIAHFGVDLVRMDELDTVRFWAMWHDGKLTLEALAGQANESRPLFPRLIILGLGSLTHWNTKAEMFVTLAMVLGNLLLLVWLARHLAGEHKWIIHPFVVFLAALALFSPWQNELLWGFQMLVHIPITCIIIGLALCHTRLPTAVLTALMIVLAFVSTYSYANGLLAWPCLGVYLMYMRGRSWRTHAVLGVALLAPFVIAVWLYFHSYVKPGYSPPFMLFTKQFLPAFLAFFGTPLGSLRGDDTGYVVSILWGGFLFLTVFVLVGTAIARRALGTTLPVFMPFLIVLGYLSVSGVVATAGRLGMGRDMIWLSTRYGGFSTYFIAIVVLLAAFTWHPGWIEKLRPHRWATHILAAACGSYLLSQAWQYQLCYRNYPVLSRDLERAKAGILLIDKVNIPELRTVVFPFPDRMRNYWAEGRRIGLFSPALSMEAFSAPQTPGAALGQVDNSHWEGNTLVAEGWAHLAGDRRADAMVFTATVGGETKVLAMSFPTVPRPDVRKELHLRETDTGWLARVECPASAAEITVWALEAPARKVHRVGSVSRETPAATRP